MYLYGSYDGVKHPLQLLLLIPHLRLLVVRLVTIRPIWSIAIPATPRIVDPIPLRIPLVIVGTPVLNPIIRPRASLVALLCTLMAIAGRTSVVVSSLPIPPPRPL